MVETDHAMAMITGSDGKTVFKTIGDVIDHAEIVEITETQITVCYHEELAPLLIEKDSGSSSGRRGYAGGRRRRWHRVEFTSSLPVMIPGVWGLTVDDQPQVVVIEHECESRLG